MVRLERVAMILDLHWQGLSVSEIARQAGLGRRLSVNILIVAWHRRVWPPLDTEEALEPLITYLRERVAAFPSLTAARLLQELRERVYAGGCTTVADILSNTLPTPLQFRAASFSPAVSPGHRRGD